MRSTMRSHTKSHARTQSNHNMLWRGPITVYPERLPNFNVVPLHCASFGKIRARKNGCLAEPHFQP